MQLSQEILMALDWYILLASSAASILSLVLLIFALGDLRYAMTLALDNDPDVTAGWQGVIEQGVRMVILMSCCALTISVLFADRIVIGIVLFWMLLLTIHLLIANSVFSWYSRRKMLNQNLVLRDPCSACPWPDSPHRAKAIRDRTALLEQGQPAPIGSWGTAKERHDMAVQQRAGQTASHIDTPEADIHVIVTPKPETVEHRKEEDAK